MHLIAIVFLYKMNGHSLCREKWGLLDVYLSIKIDAFLVKILLKNVKTYDVPIAIFDVRIAIPLILYLNIIYILYFIFNYNIKF